MSEHHFGVSTKKPSRKDALKIEAIAKKHGATFVEMNVPGIGYQHWFCCRNYGDPIDSKLADEVISDLIRQGLRE